MFANSGTQGEGALGGQKLISKTLDNSFWSIQPVPTQHEMVWVYHTLRLTELQDFILAFTHIQNLHISTDEFTIIRSVLQRGQIHKRKQWLFGMRGQYKAIQQTFYGHCFSFVFAPFRRWRQLIELAYSQRCKNVISNGNFSMKCICLFHVVRIQKRYHWKAKLLLFR